MRRLGLLFITCGCLFAQTKIESVEALAFGPGGILFVGDSLGGSIVALDTGDRTPVTQASALSVQGVDQKIAALLGTRPGDVRVHDIKVNPLSKNVYFAVSRGRGPDAIPVIVRMNPAGSLEELSLSSMRSTRVELPGLRDSEARRRRTLAITDLHYFDGKVIVAGLSNEDFSSTLRLVPYPFSKADRGASVEIYHTSHFTYETDSPVRTMVPYERGGERYLLAAYTCTPLVKLRMSDLKDAAHVRGETLAELGRHSSPIDMIQYRNRGEDYLLVVNTLHGVIRLSLEGFDKFEAVNDEGGDEAQVPSQKIASLRGVVQLDVYDDSRALVLFDLKSRLDLRLIPLP